MKCIVDGIATEYTMIGHGKPVVLMHGWGTSLKDMQGLAKVLSESFHVISVDFPGFGGSERPKEVWGVGDYAIFIQKFLDKINVKEIFMVVGHSFGGRVVIAACGRGIMNPQKVVLIGSAGIKHSSSVRTKVFKGIAKTGKVVAALPGLGAIKDGARRKLYAAAGTSDYIDAGEMKEIFSKVIDEDLQVDASKIPQPTLLVWGEHDNASPVSDAQRLHQLIKASKLVIIPRAGHFVHNDDTQGVMKAIRDFLA